MKTLILLSFFLNGCYESTQSRIIKNAEICSRACISKGLFYDGYQFHDGMLRCKCKVPDEEEK